MKTFEVVQQIKLRFSDAIAAEQEFLGETSLEIKKASLKEVLAFLKRNAGYRVLMDLTGVDYLVPSKRTKVVYWLHHPDNFNRLRIFVYAARGESLHTVTDIWGGADWYERELYDLFGIHFIEHPDFKRILMPDDWIGHPLLKDYALTEEPVEFKHGVKPKVPSEIVPHVKRLKKS